MPLDENAHAAIENICDHLTERTAALFLGAGVNDGTSSSDGTQFPLATGLAELICRDLLRNPR